MKKTYNIPTLTIVNIKPARILAGSPNPGFDPNEETGTMDARRSRFSTWEYEEDYE